MDALPYDDAIGHYYRISALDYVRLDLLLNEALTQARRGDGDFIEIGVFRGGTAGLLASAMRLAGVNRRVVLVDAWQGLPAPTFEDGAIPVPAGTFADASAASVAHELARHGLDGLCHIHEGWCEDVLPKLEEAEYSLVHLDCDLYAPTKFCLEYLLPRMTASGVIVLDDYGTTRERRFMGVERAVREVLAEHPEWLVEPLGGLRDQSARIRRRGVSG